MADVDCLAGPGLGQSGGMGRRGEGATEDGDERTSWCVSHRPQAATNGSAAQAGAT